MVRSLLGPSSETVARAEALVAPVHDRIVQRVVSGKEKFGAVFHEEVQAALARWRDELEPDLLEIATRRLCFSIEVQQRIIQTQKQRKRWWRFWR